MNKPTTDAFNYITNTTDGPATPYVMIHRAIEAARDGEFKDDGTHDPITEALFYALNLDDDDDG